MEEKLKYICKIKMPKILSYSNSGLKLILLHLNFINTLRIQCEVKLHSVAVPVFLNFFVVAVGFFFKA